MRAEIVTIPVEVIAKFDELINFSLGGNLFDLDSHFR